MKMIDITKKQPEFGLSVLTLNTQGEFDVASLWKKEETSNGFKYSFDKGGQYITHWCKLPKAPKTKCK